MADQQQQIPRKGLSEASYAVHRPSGSDAGPSNAVEVEPIEHEQHERSHTPPPYSGPASPTRAPEAQQQSQINYPGLPKLNYRLYSPPSFILSQDQTTIASRDPQLNTQRTALLTLIQKLAYIPPKPHIRIVGKGSDGSIDFDVKLNAMNLIVPEGEKQRMNYIKTIPPGELGFRGQTKKTAGPELEGLESWVRNYCEDDSSIKHFALDRIVINWDTSYLEGRLLSLLKNISYRGHVTITFPLTHSRVMIHSPDKMNRFISNVTKVFTGTHKYEPVKSIWPYANMPRGEPGRRCAVQDEDAWFSDWKDAIAHAVLSKRKSWITIEDRLEFLMEPKPMVQGKPAEWGTT